MVACKCLTCFLKWVCLISSQDRNFHYVVEIEVYLARELSFTGSDEYVEEV